MTQLRRALLHGLAVPATMLLAACSSGGAEAPKAIGSSEAAFLKENDKAMAAMMSGMTVQPTGNVDRDFALMMIPHHQGAIDMARALLKHGKDPELLALARSIIETQTEEIALMRRVAGDVPAGDGAHKMDMTHGHAM